MRASLKHNVPESAIRDRTLGLVHPDTLAAGSLPLLPV